MSIDDKLAEDDNRAPGDPAEEVAYSFGHDIIVAVINASVVTFLQQVANKESLEAATKWIRGIFIDARGSGPEAAEEKNAVLIVTGVDAVLQCAPSMSEAQFLGIPACLAVIERAMQDGVDQLKVSWDKKNSRWRVEQK